MELWGKKGQRTILLNQPSGFPWPTTPFGFQFLVIQQWRGKKKSIIGILRTYLKSYINNAFLQHMFVAKSFKAEIKLACLRQIKMTFISSKYPKDVGAQKILNKSVQALKKRKRKKSLKIFLQKKIFEAITRSLLYNMSNKVIMNMKKHTTLNFCKQHIFYIVLISRNRHQYFTEQLSALLCYWHLISKDTC